MKKLTIKQRTILERTGFRKYPYKEVTQYIVCYNHKEYRNNHSVNEANVRVHFKTILDTRSKKQLNDFVSILGRTEAEKWLKNLVSNIVECK